MNITQAKEQIKNAMQAYFSRDEYGRFLLPPEAQRPVFLIGPPGVGKTAIMKQIAGELGVGLVSYSMTHHTRQSALGLPVIEEKDYGGKISKVSEYTMSEIIASVYDMMEETGVKEGILFLDEINCVSETLIPVMLQFLQYKMLGRHAVPEGWIVVTAGNPPEYNRAARPFDLAVWDRVKRIDVEPDFAAFKAYAAKKGVHPAVMTYLEARKDRFYRVENTVDGTNFVTARGWDDLSDMIRLYEGQGLTVDEALVSQYVQDQEISEDFAIYYDLFNKYRADYQVEEILSGTAPQEILDRAAAAPFDERLSLLGLLLGRVNEEMKAACEREESIRTLHGILKEVKAGASLVEKCTEQQAAQERALRRGGLSREEQQRSDRVIGFLRRHVSVGSDFEAIRDAFRQETKAWEQLCAHASAALDALYAFVEQVWPQGHELLILTTELTAGWYAARFIARRGCDRYYRHSKDLMFYERHTEILRELEQLEQEL